MSGDKRTVTTDALETLGKIISENEKRDAIHLAVEPVIAIVKLTPGQHVGLVDGGAGPCDNNIGIVDPFLEEEVKLGQRFWLVVYPRQITSLRHVWTHPAFEKDAKDVSELWLRRFVENNDCPKYEILIAGAIGELARDEDGYGYSSNDGRYLHFGGYDAHGDIPSEFWDHVEIVTGKNIPKDMRSPHFSCSC